MKGASDRTKWIALGVFALIAAGVVAAILISRGGDGGETTAASAPGCRAVEAPQVKHVSYGAPKQTVKAGESLTAVVETSCGTFQIALDTERAPKTVNSFVFLSEKGSTTASASTGSCRAS
jgi:peptidyl-prolyl cis-trans isomerase B (cyclophilin B)